MRRSHYAVTNMAAKSEKPCELTLDLQPISPDEDSSGSCESINGAPPQTPSSPSKAKPDNVVFRQSNRTIYTAGRPPWYNLQGQLKEPFVIGLCGGSASGKTTVANKIIEQLGVPWVSMLSLDSFYKVLTPEQHKAALRNEYNFDHPGKVDERRIVLWSYPNEYLLQSFL
ncbi:uridine-cytidine kinase-like 1 [Pocillopora damicornis]|uniref:uridine-cytidine kinase-like 1 n=1 Tax=Pocillopora damicornis TaxID=46731 RepID=UPI000F54FB14|nr:uridine-cytidine kinase-like 1 [Pocillopora damicornis]